MISREALETRDGAVKLQSAREVEGWIEQRAVRRDDVLADRDPVQRRSRINAKADSEIYGIASLKPPVSSRVLGFSPGPPTKKIQSVRIPCFSTRSATSRTFAALNPFSSFSRTVSLALSAVIPSERKPAIFIARNSSDEAVAGVKLVVSS